MGWKVLVHLPLAHFPPHIIAKALDVSKGMVKLVRELGEMIKSILLRVYSLLTAGWHADNDRHTGVKPLVWLENFRLLQNQLHDNK